MPYGMYVSASGAETQKQRMQVLSHNLANVDTVGFKKELMILQARNSEAIDRGLDYSGSKSINDIGGGVKVRETVTDLSAGPILMTGKKTDLAIDGEGFFAVMKDGRQMLTRAGNFSVDQNGQLTTPQGYPVLSEAGAPVVIDPRAPIQFSGDGAITQAGKKGASLAILRPQSPGELRRAGENLFETTGEPTAVAPEQRRVKSEALEGSAVDATGAMVELIETSRAYEANIKMIQQQDQTLGQLLGRVLRF